LSRCSFFVLHNLQVQVCYSQRATKELGDHHMSECLAPMLIQMASTTSYARQSSMLPLSTPHRPLFIWAAHLDAVGAGAFGAGISSGWSTGEVVTPGDYELIDRPVQL
jgi:hypothetical protein